MPHRPRGTRKAREAGISTVEVVLGFLILVLLAGVVAFAVRDLTERNTTSSCTTDTRMLRTAADAYAGSVVGAGRYTADEAELVATGFLARPSTLHDLALKDPADPGGGVNITVQDPRCGGAAGTVTDGRTSF